MPHLKNASRTSVVFERNYSNLLPVETTYHFTITWSVRGRQQLKKIFESNSTKIINGMKSTAFKGKLVLYASLALKVDAFLIL